jgi:hypothetical protein
MEFGDKSKSKVSINTIMSNLGGAKSNLTDVWTFARSFLESIDKTDK